MYDLPMKEYEQTKEYTKFRKSLISLGFYKVQYSVYTKVVANKKNAPAIINRVKRDIPSGGEIRVFYITEKQYQQMDFLRGEKSKQETIVGDNRIVVIGDLDE